MRAHRKALKEARKARPDNSHPLIAPDRFEDGIKQDDLARLENEGGSSSPPSNNLKPFELATNPKEPVMVGLIPG